MILALTGDEWTFVGFVNIEKKNTSSDSKDKLTWKCTFFFNIYTVKFVTKKNVYHVFLVESIQLFIGVLSQLSSLESGCIWPSDYDGIYSHSKLKFKCSFWIFKWFIYLKFNFLNAVNLTSNAYFNFNFETKIPISDFESLIFCIWFFFIDSGLSATRFQKMCTHEFITRWVLIHFLKKKWYLVSI